MASIAIAEHELETPARPAGFSEGEVAALAEPVRRFFRAAIKVGTPLSSATRLRMRGRVKVGVWLPFRAEQILSPHHGLVWRARVLGVLTGADRYADGAGVSQWKVFGVATVIDQRGPDTSRSSAGRCGIEAMWLPTVLLPRFGVTWDVLARDHIVAGFTVGDTPVELQYRTDEQGLPRSLRIDRWGDPDGTGTFGWHPFGGEFSSHRTFGGLTIPDRGRFGWSFGTAEWQQGEFVRYEITALEPVA